MSQIQYRYRCLSNNIIVMESRDEAVGPPANCFNDPSHSIDLSSIVVLSVSEPPILHADLSNAGVHTHSQVDAHIDNSDLHRVVNDLSDSTTVLWSAAKIAAMCADISGSIDNHTHSASDVTDFAAAVDAQVRSPMLSCSLTSDSAPFIHLAGTAVWRAVTSFIFPGTNYWGSGVPIVATVAHNSDYDDVKDASGADASGAVQFRFINVDNSTIHGTSAILNTLGDEMSTVTLTGLLAGKSSVEVQVRFLVNNLPADRPLSFVDVKALQVSDS